MSQVINKFILNPVATQTSNAGKILTTDGTNTSWVSPSVVGAPALFASSPVTTVSGAITATTFTTFDNSPAFTFIPSVSGSYKVYSSIPLFQSTQGVVGTGRIFNTSGGATLLFESDGGIFSNTTGTPVNSAYIQSVYTLTAGTSYVFDIQGKNNTTGNLQVEGNDIPFYMFAELVVTTGGSGGTNAIRTVTTSTTLLSTDNYIISNGSSITLTLPAVIVGELLNIKNISTTTLTIAPSSGTIDGSSTITLPVQNTSVSLISDGTNWFIF